MKPARRPSWYLFLLLKNRWFLVKALMIVMIPTVVVTYLLEKKYTVTTLIMPPEVQSSSGLSIAGLGLSEFAGFFSGGMGFSLPLMTTLSDVYLEMLSSRTLTEHVILSTGYIHYSDLEDKFAQDRQLGMYWARRKFNRNYSVSLTPSGFLQIKVTTDDPLYSVEISETVVATLDSINACINISRAAQAREFLELRSVMADSTLANARNLLQSFEEEHGIIALDAEMEAFVQSLAGLKQQYILLRTGAAALRRGISGGTSASALIREREAEELLGVIRMLETGVAPPGYEDAIPSVSIAGLPDIQFTYASLRSEYEMALEVASFIRIRLQQSIAEESRRQPPIRVLDPPRHPGWKSSPKRLYIWIEVFAVALILLISFLIIRENLAVMRSERPQDWSDWQNLLSEIRRDFKPRGKG